MPDHALRNNLELLLIGPAPPPTGFNNAEPFKLSTALIAVHKDCYTALNQIRQGGLHRRKTGIVLMLPWASSITEPRAPVSSASISVWPG